MNLANNPTKQQLSTLLRLCSDNEVSHLLWVEKNGEVHLDTLRGITPAGFVKKHSDVYKFKYESFAQGNGYTGEVAARDEQWVSQLFGELTRAWAGKHEGTVD